MRALGAVRDGGGGGGRPTPAPPLPSVVDGLPASKRPALGLEAALDRLAVGASPAPLAPVAFRRVSTAARPDSAGAAAALAAAAATSLPTPTPASHGGRYRHITGARRARGRGPLVVDLEAPSGLELTLACLHSFQRQ